MLPKQTSHQRNKSAMNQNNLELLMTLVSLEGKRKQEYNQTLQLKSLNSRNKPNYQNFNQATSHFSSNSNIRQKFAVQPKEIIPPRKCSLHGSLS